MGLFLQGGGQFEYFFGRVQKNWCYTATENTYIVLGDNVIINQRKGLRTRVVAISKNVHFTSHMSLVYYI